MGKIAVIDTETNWNDEVMSIGVVVADAVSFLKTEERYYILDPEYYVGGMYEGVLHDKRASNPFIGSRKEAMSDICSWLHSEQVDSIFAYNASFDMNHLNELQDFGWYDIMKIAAYKQHNSAIPASADCFKTGRLKTNFGVEPITRLLTNNDSYHEVHNAILDANDELHILELLGHPVEYYDCAFVGGKKTKTEKKVQKRENSSTCTKSSLTDSTIRNAKKTAECVTEKSSYRFVKINDKIVGYGDCTSAEAAKLLGVSKSTVYNMIDRGDIMASKIGNRYEVSVESIAYYLEEKIRRRKLRTLISRVSLAVLIIILLCILIILFV